VETLRTDDPSFVGPIRLLGRLGAGGMGRVYLGADAAAALVAVKVEPGGQRGGSLRWRLELPPSRSTATTGPVALADGSVAGGIGPVVHLISL